MEKPELYFNCSQKWERMSPSEGGRHCNVCNKIVVDFSKLSNEEILTYLSQNNSGRVCGSYEAQQLSRPFKGWRGILFNSYMQIKEGRNFLMRPAIIGILGITMILSGCHHKRRTTGYRYAPVPPNHFGNIKKA